MSDRTPPRRRNDESRPPAVRRNRRRRNSQADSVSRRRINFDANNGEDERNVPEEDEQKRPDYDPNQATGRGEDKNRNQKIPEQSTLKF